jgi:hypothetical protein
MEHTTRSAKHATSILVGSLIGGKVLSQGMLQFLFEMLKDPTRIFAWIYDISFLLGYDNLLDTSLLGPPRICAVTVIYRG